MGKLLTVDERDLLDALKRVRDLRAWAVRARVDPWVLRQALLLAIHIDTVAALERGVPLENLRTFDRLVEEDAEIQLKEAESG